MEPLLEYIDGLHARATRRLRHRRPAGVRAGAVVASPLPQPARAAHQGRAAVPAEHDRDQRAVSPHALSGRHPWRRERSATTVTCMSCARLTIRWTRPSRNHDRVVRSFRREMKICVMPLQRAKCARACPRRRRPGGSASRSGGPRAKFSCRCSASRSSGRQLVEVRRCFETYTARHSALQIVGHTPAAADERGAGRVRVDHQEQQPVARRLTRGARLRLRRAARRRLPASRRRTRSGASPARAARPASAP